MEDPKVEGVPDLDDLLQCPVCYEIPTGQIFQCNEGHHVCGRCKVRLDVCPVCRAFFFGTRNYAMEELIANVRKLRTFKLGGKVTTGAHTVSPTNEDAETKESSSEETSTNIEEDDISSRSSMTPPAPCSGLFRCLCCKINPERLPSARLLNHLRYYHSPELIESRSENGEYVQAWQFSTENGKIVTAIRVADMGLFFLVIEITSDVVYAWLSMAASPVVAEEFSYTFTLSGNDREAIFSDCVWSVRTCEGFLKKRERCLSVSGSNARALLSPTTMNARLSLRRTAMDFHPNIGRPRAILRVANRSHSQGIDEATAQNLEPYYQDLRHNMLLLSRSFETFGREATAFRLTDAEMHSQLEQFQPSTLRREAPPEPEVRQPLRAETTFHHEEPPRAPLYAPHPPYPFSRNSRRRMRQRLRQSFRLDSPDESPSGTQEMEAGLTPSDRTPPANNVARANSSAQSNARMQIDPRISQQNANFTQTNTSPNNNRQNIPENVMWDRPDPLIVNNGLTYIQVPMLVPLVPRIVSRADPTLGQPIITAPLNYDGDNNNEDMVTRVSDEPINVLPSGTPVVEPSVAPPPAAPTAAHASGHGNGGRNKRKRRQR